MALATGSHVKIGSFELNLAVDQPDHYVHRYETLWANRSDITGLPGNQNLRQEIILWGYTDWSGGEGLKFYDPNRPNVYYKGQANGRNPGELNNPPARASGTKTTNATPNKIMFASGSGNLYLAAGCDATAGGANHFFESTDGTTWASKNAGFVAGDVISAMASDGHFIYVSTITGAGARKLHRYNPDAGSQATFTADVAGSVKFFDMAFAAVASGGKLYGWNGKALFEYDVTATLPVAATQVYVSGEATVPSGASGGIAAAENSVVFFYSAEGHSQLMEYGLGQGAGAKPLWRPPGGFVIKQIAYQLGVVFIGGDYQGKKALFALSLVSRQPLFLGYVRPGTSLTFADICSSFGSDVMILSNDGHAFIYNISTDAVSELDDLTSTGGTFAACTTYKGKRIAAKYSTTTTTTYTWGPDDGSLSTTQSSAPESPAYDLGIGQEDKVLYGFHVVSSTLDGAGNNIVVSYDLDETGSYTALTTLVSGKTNFAPLANPAAFRQMRFKVATNGTAKAFKVLARVGVLASTQVWDLIVDLRPSTMHASKQQADRADIVRAELIKLTENRATITFRDGVPFQKKADVAWDGSAINDGSANDVPHSGYRTYTAVVESPEDHVTAGTASGTMRIRLRQVPTS